MGFREGAKLRISLYFSYLCQPPTPFHMTKYQRLNNLLGWIVFAIASTVYILTSEPTMSFWDCGEYIATAYKLEVGHPPGAPLFQMIGRFFTLFAFGDTALVASW